MKTYNEIYPIEGWADKISKHLGKIAEEKPNMYAKTKRRYAELADSLLDSVAKIAIILEEDSLVSKSNDEFNELSGEPELSISDRIQKLNSKFHQVEDLASSNVKSNSSFRVHKDTIDYFDTIFTEASVTNFGYSEVNECARMLHRWFHTRFNPDIPDVNFKFNIHCLGTWICDFIIVYGKYHSLKKNGQFVEMIDKWCKDVESGLVGIYAIPYPVFQLRKDNNPSDYTIDAVVINDILSNVCLYKLSSYENTNCVIHYDHDVMVTVVKDKNPSLHSKIVTRIAKRKELIKEIGLTPVGGLVSNE